MTGTAPSHPRNARAAVLLSLATPGLGHLYAGQLRLAIGALILTQIGGFLAIIAVLALAPLGTIAVILALLLSLTTLLALLIHAYRIARRAPQDYQLQPFNRWWVYIAGAAVFLFIWQPLYLRLIRQHLLEAYRISSPAMAPTLLTGDFIFVTRRHSDRTLFRDECVVIQRQDRVTVVKRVVGLPGDTLTMRAGSLIRNGHEVHEPWAQVVDTSGSPAAIEDGLAWQRAHMVGDTASYRPTMREWGPVVIPPDSVFVLGDNRDESFDSRSYGAVPVREVKGYPILIYLSLTPRGGNGPWIRLRRIGTRPWVAA
jgi:signal peptidase I